MKEWIISLHDFVVEAETEDEAREAAEVVIAEAQVWIEDANES